MRRIKTLCWQLVFVNGLIMAVSVLYMLIAIKTLAKIIKLAVAGCTLAMLAMICYLVNKNKFLPKSMYSLTMKPASLGKKI
ncbi:MULTISPECIES: OpgC domain-containing protein [Moraxella]|uniref:OpgC domain-containing protein n=1 Tax=Moraxella catarrhalis TaxID=480 RepID=UPI000E1BACB1